MKLFFIVQNISNCGAERVLSLLVNELASRGHNVYVLTDIHNINYFVDSRVSLLDAYEGINTSYKNNRISKLLRFIRINVGQYRILKKYLHQIKPDAIVSFMGMCIWPLLLFRKKYRIIISDHSAMNRDISRLVNFERHYLAELFYCQTVLTESDKAYMGDKRSNIKVINDPLTFTPISEEEYHFIFNKRTGILACGSVKRYFIKGFDNLIKAFAAAAKDHCDWQLDVVGDGDDESLGVLERIAVEHGVLKQVHFLGFQVDVSSFMKSHSLLVLASRSEGFGMVITEAMASGCPVVAYDLSGPSEIINNGFDGWLVENQNIDALAERIKQVMLDAEGREKIGLNALSSVKRFSIDAIVDQWEELFRSDVIAN